MQVERETNSRRRTQKLLFHNELNESYDKARGRTKKGFRSLFSQTAHLGSSSDPRTIGPRGEDSCEHWGKTIPISGPWTSQTLAALTAEMYATSPGTFHTQHGKPGACAAGTCGGQGRCASGAVSVCGAGCTGVRKQECSSVLFFANKDIDRKRWVHCCVIWWRLGI